MTPFDLFEPLQQFPRQRFQCDLQHAVRVVRWHARSSAFVRDLMVWAQWPQLCYEMGRVVVDFNGPDDLQLVAIVEPIRRGRVGELMPVAFMRQARIDELIARSSLGEPDAAMLRATADPKAVARTLERAAELEREPDSNPMHGIGYGRGDDTAAAARKGSSRS
jgi:hypothetical protein